MHEDWDMSNKEPPKRLSAIEKTNWLRATGKASSVTYASQKSYTHDTEADGYGSDDGNTNTLDDPHLADTTGNPHLPDTAGDYIADNVTEGLLAAGFELLTLAKDSAQTKTAVEPAMAWNHRQEHFSANWDQLQPKVLPYLAGTLSGYAVLEGEVCSRCSKPATVSCSACNSFVVQVFKVSTEIYIGG